jgi:hypothetical protein
VIHLRAAIGPLKPILRIVAKGLAVAVPARRGFLTAGQIAKGVELKTKGLDGGVGSLSEDGVETLPKEACGGLS